MAEPVAFRIGADENGLGARLGPLVVTAVLARATPGGLRALARRPPKRLAADLGDSKDLVSHGNVTLGEAWARALVGPVAATPAALFERLAHEARGHLREPCPPHVEAQCWSVADGSFAAAASDVARLTGHLQWWRDRGIEILAVQSSVICTKRLNDAKTAGKNRFVSDLHAMERLIVSLRREAGSDVTAVCGKVGGMRDYSKFFGPLSDRLHAVVELRRAVSAYRFPGIGDVRFVQDADSIDSLVMLASIVGKYVRELLMGNVSDYYRSVHPDLDPVSGYHDPLTARFVEATALTRRERLIPAACFERSRDSGP